MQKQPNILGLWANLMRAIEIAKIGNYTVSVHFDQNYKSGFDDYKSIKNFCMGWFEDFVCDGDLKVHIVKPESYDISVDYITINELSKAIDGFKQFPTPPMIMDSACTSLLRLAIDKLYLSFDAIEKAKQVAATIAQRELCDKITAPHLTEALQYSYVYDDWLNAESEAILFGNMIQVKVGPIQESDINDAIEYLKSMITEDSAL